MFVSNFDDLISISTPAGTPAANHAYVYLKSDGLLYSKTSAGVETVINGGYTPAIMAYPLIGGAILAEPLGGGIANITTSLASVDQQLIFTLVYLPKAATITGVKWYQATAGVYTSNNYNGVGLYSLSGGTATLLSSSTDDGTIWKATASTFPSKALAASQALAKGIYVVAALYCRSAVTTEPILGCLPALNSSAVNIGDFTNSVKINSTLAAQTAMPSPTKAMSAMSSINAQRYFALY